MAAENHPGKFRSCVSVYFHLQSIDFTVLWAHSWVILELEAERNNGLGKADTPTKESICSAASLCSQQNRRTRLELSNTPVTLHAGKRLTNPHHSPLQFPIQPPWQTQGGGTDEWWLHSLLWAGTNLVARFCYWSGLRCARHVITSSHVTPTQQLLRAPALTGCRDGATCALGEQIVLNPNWIVEKKKNWCDLFKCFCSARWPTPPRKPCVPATASCCIQM